MADPIQSIRVASALLGRFPGLMKQASATESEMELAIGEANQIYPEVWRHMDEARSAIAADHDVSHYDALRATVLAGLGITQIGFEEAHWTVKGSPVLQAFLGDDYRPAVLHTSHRKVAGFDFELYERAKAACKALMVAMPEVDWAEMAREDVRTIAAAGSLRSAKYKTATRIAMIGGGIALATFGIYYVVTGLSSSGVSDDEAAEMRARAAERDAQAKKLAESVEAKRARIDALRVSVKARCQPAEIAELVKLLREEGQLTDAKKLEAARCTPTRPACKPVPGVILDRLAAQYESVLAAPASVHCEGILTTGAPPVPALSVWFMDKGKIMRGVVSEDGKKDLVPFSVGPGLLLVAHGDLDDDGTDEALFATDRDMWVTKIANGAFVDTPGPRSKKKCQEEVNIVHDLRPDKTRRDRVVISVRESRGCESQWTYLKLADGKLVVEE